MLKRAEGSDSELIDRLKTEAHVWHTSPEEITSAAKIAQYESLLSRSELERQRRFRFPEDRHRYLVSHALVRQVLSRYVNIDPAGWQFSIGRYGRPELAEGQTTHRLRFNLTHTDGLAACVVTLELDCGIDAERIHDRGNLSGIAKKMFSEAEQQRLENSEGAAYLERFFSYWTLREAYCKARGTGIANSSEQFCFETGANGSAGIQFYGVPSGAGDHWHFHLLHPSPKHLVAVALDSHGSSPPEVVSHRIIP